MANTPQWRFQNVPTNMNEPDRLSRIDTLWSVVRRAHAGPEDEARDAQQQLLERYAIAIRKYLVGALRDQAAADELYQEFALRLLQGDFANADPERGRFRAFVKTILFRMVAEYYRKQKRRKSIPLGSAVLNQQTADEPTEEESFTAAWRDGLLGKAWSHLERSEQEKSRPVYTVMNAFVSDPGLSSAEQAARLSESLGRDFSAQNVRVILHRARKEFAEFLISEVRNTLELPTREALENELIELRLHRYCQPVLD